EASWTIHRRMRKWGCRGQGPQRNRLEVKITRVMSDFISISASSATLSGRPPAAVHAPEIEPGVGCDFDSYLLVPDNTLDDRIAAAKARLGEDVVILGHHYQRVIRNQQVGIEI